MMQINLHQTHHLLADFQEIQKTLIELALDAQNKGLNILPELFLTGYPLQDLCLQQSFIERYQTHLEELDIWCQKKWKSESETAILAGGLSYEFDHNHLVKSLKNVVYELRPGKALRVVATKKLLPNYDIFDEEKYFTPGRESTCYEFGGKRFGILVCEDMWTSTLHPIDPVSDLWEVSQTQKIQFDGIINLSASPYILGKQKKRQQRAQEISQLFGAPMIYVNRIGGEDEILFDGQSFVVQNDQVIVQGPAYQKSQIRLELPSVFKSTNTAQTKAPENTWEDLFCPHLEMNKKEKRPQLQSLNDSDCAELLQSLSFGLQEYTQKTGFSKFTVALSGGLDSSLVLAIAKLALRPGQELEAIYMPGFFSAPESYEYSHKLCQNLGLRLKSLPIKFLHSSIRNTFNESFGTPMEGLADENIQSRLRGALIYARSNQWNSLVINTSNKSEIAVGYSTLYGDSVGAISLLGDLYKTEVYQLAHYINQLHPNLIPEGIITRAPSAELRENQSDAQSLPPYEILDAILEGFLSYRYSEQQLVNSGFELETVKKVYGLYQKSEYKRKQFCPIIKVKAKSFGFGYRVPICKKIETLA